MQESVLHATSMNNDVSGDDCGVDAADVDAEVEVGDDSGDAIISDTDLFDGAEDLPLGEPAPPVDTQEQLQSQAEDIMRALNLPNLDSDDFPEVTEAPVKRLKPNRIRGCRDPTRAARSRADSGSRTPRRDGTD